MPVKVPDRLSSVLLETLGEHLRSLGYVVDMEAQSSKIDNVLTEYPYLQIYIDHRNFYVDKLPTCLRLVAHDANAPPIKLSLSDPELANKVVQWLLQNSTFRSNASKGIT